MIDRLDIFLELRSLLLKLGTKPWASTFWLSYPVQSKASPNMQLNYYHHYACSLFLVNLSSAVWLKWEKFVLVASLTWKSLHLEMMNKWCTIFKNEKSNKKGNNSALYAPLILSKIYCIVMVYYWATYMNAGFCMIIHLIKPWTDNHWMLEDTHWSFVITKNLHVIDKKTISAFAAIQNN